MTRNSIMKLTLFSFFLSLVLMSISYADEEPPVACFSANVSTGYIPFEVQFTDLSSGGITSWEWDFGDFTDIVALQEPTHEFDMPGDFEVTLTVTNLYGSSSASLIIDADVDLIASFTSEVTPDTFPVDVYFNDTSEGDVVSWEWDFDNDSVIDSTEQYPKHTYTVAGTYLVSLTVTDYYDEVDTITDIVVIESQPPAADFSSNVIAGTAPLQVQFTNESTGDIDLYEWDFDNDGNIDSTDINPVNDFDYTGFYTVRLKVTGPLGINEIVKDEYISVYSGTIEVTSGVNTIQDAINLASNGYRILVHDGTYTGAGNKDIDFGGKAIHIVSENGAENTIIDIQNSGRGFYFHTSENSSSVLEGFTIQNGNEAADNGGGIRIVDSSPRIKNCTIQNCSGNNGGGISIESTSNPLLEFCTMQNNTSTLDGAGIYINASSPILRDCIVRYNHANGKGGICIYNQSDVSLQALLIIQNTADVKGGGIYSDSSNPNFYNCTIADNTSANDGGGLYLRNSSIIEMNNSIIWGNAAGSTYSGNMIFLEDANSSTTANYCCFPSSTLDPNRIGGNGSLNYDDYSINENPLFTDPLNGFYMLRFDKDNPSLCSPCLNAGNMALVPVCLIYDLVEVPIFRDETTTNMGPFMDESSEKGCHSPSLELTSSAVLDPKMWNLPLDAENKPLDVKFTFTYKLHDEELAGGKPATCSNRKVVSVTVFRGDDEIAKYIAPTQTNPSPGNKENVEVNGDEITWNCRNDNHKITIDGKEVYAFADPHEYKLTLSTSCSNCTNGETVDVSIEDFYIARLGVWGVEGGHIGETEEYFYSPNKWMPLYYWKKSTGHPKIQSPYRYTLFQMCDLSSTSSAMRKIQIGLADDNNGVKVSESAFPSPYTDFNEVPRSYLKRSYNYWYPKHNFPLVYKCVSSGTNQYSIELRGKLVDKCISQESGNDLIESLGSIMPKEIKLTVSGELIVNCGENVGEIKDIVDFTFKLSDLSKLQKIVLKFPERPLALYSINLKWKWSYKGKEIPGEQKTTHIIYLIPASYIPTDPNETSVYWDWLWDFLDGSDIDPKSDPPGCRRAGWKKRTSNKVPWARVLNDVCRWGNEQNTVMSTKNNTYKAVIRGFWNQAKTKNLTYSGGMNFSYATSEQIKKADLTKFFTTDNTTISCIDCSALTTVFFQMIGCKEVHPVISNTLGNKVGPVCFIPNENTQTLSIANHYYATPSGGIPAGTATDEQRKQYMVLDACLRKSSTIWYDPMNFYEYCISIFPDKDNRVKFSADNSTYQTNISVITIE